MRFSVAIWIIAFALHSNAQNTLEYFIQKAQENSPLINDNRNQGKANQLEIERLKAFYTKPQIGIAANYLFAPILSTDGNQKPLQPNAYSATNYFGYDLAYSNGGQYQAMLNVTQPLLNGKRYSMASEQFSVSSQINENNAKLNEHDIEKIVGDQYIICLQDKKQIAYAEQMTTLLSEQQEILKKLIENGIYKQSDLALLNTEYNNFQIQLSAFWANYKRDLMDLNILCGINDTSIVQIQNTELKIKNAVAESKFLEKYRLDSINLITQQNLFEIKYKPQLNFFANTGLNAVYAPTIPNRFGLSVGLSLTYNFYDGNQKRINRSKIQVLEQSVSGYKSNFIIQNRLRKSKILNELQSYSERISISEKQLKNYELLLNSYRKEILSGQLSIINYITVLKNLASLQRDYALLFSQRELLINAYNYWNW